ncbi:hypothetical protein NQ043_09620 [Staphylococcus hyicus]|uniref:hypothetical protein n=1 Tax=Staphylococcus hyicus TaxID=1284 RepID=UPI00211CDCDD|nr:hypothetical protein [Staphylococcus hyicus]MCQ9301384.1 hypothetical protein [Staphylococcus hyicus]
MDINTINATVNNSIVQFEGSAYELLIELRQRAIGEIKILLEKELLLGLNENQQNYYVSNEERELFVSSIDETNYNMTEDEIVQVSDVETSDEINSSLGEQFDLELVNKIQNIADFVGYADEIIKAKGNGEFSSTPVDEIITEFKKINSVKENYGEFVISTGFKTL